MANEKMVLSVKRILFVCVTMLITDTYAQSEYGEDYKYDEPTEYEYYYYNDNGEDSGLQQETITTEDPSLTSW